MDIEREAYLNVLARKRIARRKRREAEISGFFGFAGMMAMVWLMAALG